MHSSMLIQKFRDCLSCLFAGVYGVATSAPRLHSERVVLCVACSKCSGRATANQTQNPSFPAIEHSHYIAAQINLSLLSHYSCRRRDSTTLLDAYLSEKIDRQIKPSA